MTTFLNSPNTLRFFTGNDVAGGAAPSRAGSYVTSDAPRTSRPGSYVTTTAPVSARPGSYVTTSAAPSGPGGCYAKTVQHV